jgi:hypothetical protein
MKIGHFGPGVIGKKKAAEEAKTLKEQSHRYGPGILDKDLLTRARNRARQLREPVETREAPPPADQEAQDHMLGIRGLTEALKANPMLVDEFMHAELSRPDGIRKTAVTRLIDAEKKRPGGSRPEVLAVLGDWEKGAE